MIPIKNQYEQVCNATALKKLGVDTSKKFYLEQIKTWVKSEKIIPVNYNYDIETALKKILLND